MSNSPCPICKSANTAFFANTQDYEYCTSDEVYAYFHCQDCRVIFLANPPINALNTIYPKNYYSYRPDNSDGLLQKIKKKLDGRLFRKILQNIPGDNLKILDVGGGCGWLASLIRKQDPRVCESHVLDLDASAQEAAKKLGHHFHFCNAEAFTTTEKFDFMILLNIIEHVADPSLMLQNLRFAIAPNGKLLLKTPNTDTLDVRLFRHHNWGGYHCPRHWVLFDQKNLAELAETAGWHVEWVRYTQGAPQLASTFLAFLASRKWIAITAEKPMYMHWLLTPAMAAGAVLDLLRLPFAKTSQMFMLLAPK